MTELMGEVWVLESHYDKLSLDKLYILGNMLGKIINIKQLSAHNEYLLDEDYEVTVYLVEIISELK